MTEYTKLIELVVNDITRVITIPNNNIVLGVVGDIEVNKLMFKMPRYYCGFDMSEFTPKINYVTPNAEGNYYKSELEVTDDVITFTWLLTSDVTEHNGTVKFSISLYKKENGRVSKVFNSRSSVGNVLEGLNVDAYVTPEQQQTILDRLETEIREDIQSFVTEKEASINQQITEKSDAAIKAIDAKKNDVLSTISEDQYIQKIEQNAANVGSLRGDLDYQEDKFGIIKKLDKVILSGGAIKVDGTIDTVGGIQNLVKVNVLNEPRIHVKGDIYKQTGVSYVYVSYAFIDSSGNVIDYAKFDDTKNVNEWMECPNNSEYALFSVVTDSLNDFEVYVYSPTVEELDKKEDKSSSQNIRDDISLIDSVKKYLISGNTKVDYDFVVGETFKDFRTKGHNIIKNFKCQLYDNVVYQWQMKTTNNFAHQYGSNIKLSIGHIDEEGNIEYYAQNILALTNFSHPNMSNANYIRIYYTQSWTNAVDNQSIDYINIFQLSDGNNYSGFFLTDCKPLTNYWHNKIGDSIGDSITGQGFFQKYVKNYFGLQYFYNHGIGGTKMSGGTTEYGDAMWMDSRVNALSPYANFITVMGGQNDINVTIGDISISNSDTDTYCGAFNVLISKLLYKYCKCDGYYSSIDYSGITQIDIAKYVTIIPMTPFYVPNTTSQLEEKADAIRKLSQMWSLKIADLKSECGSNFGVSDIYWGTDRTHPLESFHRDRIAPIIISVMENNKPIAFD